jgi:hypothetical protein
MKNMKNKFKYTVLGILFFCTFFSCTDWLDIKPKDNMILEDFWKNSSDVESAVYACYRALIEDDFMERILLAGEFRSDNVVEGRDMSAEQVLMYYANILETNSLVKWESFYRVINYCNTVLSQAPGVVEIDPDYTGGMMHAHEAEALTIRALCYFYLVRIYKEVPFITEPYIDDDQDFYIPQTSEEIILNSLTEDLKKAEIYAAKAWGTTVLTKGRVTKNAVRALLADIYLWQFKYEECISTCDRILADVITEEEYLTIKNRLGNELMLVNNRMTGDTRVDYNLYEIFYKGNSMESIFELQFDVNEKSNTKVFDFYGKPENDGRGQWSAAPFEESKGLFERTDVRAKDFFKPKNEGFYWIFKYIGGQRNENSQGVSSYSYFTGWTPNWIIYRLPDIMLMKAEALVELGDNRETLEEAFALFYQVYMRSNPNQSVPPSFDTYSTQATMRELIMTERQRELLFEGKRWFDLLRRARRENSTNSVKPFIVSKYTLNSGIVGSKLSVLDAFYWPIHLDELISNPALNQNPFYERVGAGAD